MGTINSFPGYECIPIPGTRKVKNMYRGIDLGMGGYIISNPGMYENIVLLDATSLHPTSAINLGYYGEYAKNFEDLVHARVFIKHGDYDSAKKLLNGKLAPYLDDPDKASALAQALKIAINSTYGLTSANFDNPFRDPRNINNIVALRGALTMKTLQDEVEARGFKIVAIKTDSIKIADATDDIVQFCMDFGTKYGYNFEHEATYDRICQINDADYIAKYKGGKHDGEWTATGAQFAKPYVFKTLFSGEDTTFDDICETKEVKKGAIYLDMNEGLPEAEHDYRFIGRVGQFCPIKPGCGGGILTCINGEKYSAVSGTKGYRWLEAEEVRKLHKEDDIDISYHRALVDKAITEISKYGDFDWFVSDRPYSN